MPTVVRDPRSNLPQIGGSNPAFPFPISLVNVRNKSVELEVRGGLLTSDAGALLLREVEEQIGLIKAMVEAIHDPRDARYVKHTLPELLSQRVAQIACGYEDANDCNDLRNDPVFKMLAGRFPELGEALASHPTMSRFEPSISRTMLYRLAKAFVDTFVASYEKAPETIVLECEDPNNNVHGGQQFSFFNGGYGENCFMPLHVYEGVSGKLITTILKPGKRSTGKQMLASVKRLISYLRAKWPKTLIVFRGDSHFTYPEIMDWSDTEENVMFVTGVTGNARLQEAVKALVEHEKQIFESYKQKGVRVHSFYYQAGSWSTSRRVIANIEVAERGTNIRFGVTDMEHAKARALYRVISCARGEDELYIKDHKRSLKSERSSCQTFAAKQFRLFLHSAAYVFLHTLKTNLLKHTPFANATMETIHLRLLKIGARIRELTPKVKGELSSAYPLKDILGRSFQIFALLRGP